MQIFLKLIKIQFGILTFLGWYAYWESSYRRFGTKYQSHIKRQTVQEDRFYLNFFVRKVLICYHLPHIIEHWHIFWTSIGYCYFYFVFHLWSKAWCHLFQPLISCDPLHENGLKFCLIQVLFESIWQSNDLKSLKWWEWLLVFRKCRHVHEWKPCDT